MKLVRARAIDAAMAVRSVPLIGRRFTCPCCGWKLRHFTRGGRSIKAKPSGYCPRCNSKARHRWLWIWLAEHTTLFDERCSVLHVAPGFSTHRAMLDVIHNRYVTAGLDGRRSMLRTDLESPAIRPAMFDLILCIHVLEHADDDLAAMASLFELVRPGGNVVVGVPVAPSTVTREDPSITDPEARRAAFGEADHRRWYGTDISQRLENTGFIVEAFDIDDEDPEISHRFGLKTGEGLFLCTRPES